MTQQKIIFRNSSKEIRESFISHIKKAIFSDDLSKTVSKLENLHKYYDDHKKLLKKGTDQSTVFHKAIYSSFDEPNYFVSEFWKNYRKLSWVELPSCEAKKLSKIFSG